MKQTIKFILMFFFLFFSLFPTFPQQYYTPQEAELMFLEKITEDLKMKNEELQKTLTNLQSLQVRLKAKLKRKESLLKDLKNSFDKYERETANSINELKMENENQKGKISRLRAALIIVSIILLIIIVCICLVIWFLSGDWGYYK